MENEFYEFALEQFQFVRAHGVREKDGELFVLAQNFFYEKIYPKVNWTQREKPCLLTFVFSIIATEEDEERRKEKMASVKVKKKKKKELFVDLLPPQS